MWRPKQYQEEAGRFILNNDNTAIALKPGRGKTATVLACFAKHFQEGKAKSMLVVTQKNIALTTWPQEVSKWKQLQNISCGVLVGEAEEIDIKIAHNVWSINIDSLPWLLSVFREHIDTFTPPDWLVVDECTSYKNIRTRRWKIMEKLLYLFPVQRKVVMSGTMATENLLDIYGQMKLLGVEKLLGDSYKEFRREYFKPNISEEDVTKYYRITGRGLPQKWEPLEMSAELIANKLRRFIFDAPEDTDTPLPKCKFYKHEIEFTPTIKDRYKTVKSSVVQDIMSASGDIVAGMWSFGAVAVTSKLRQFTSGFLYLNDINTKKVVHTNYSKACYLKELVSRISTPVFLLNVFEEDIGVMRETIDRDIAYIGGATKDKDRVKILDRWADGDIPILAAQCTSAGFGLNLQGRCKDVIWYTLPYSNLLFSQANARVARLGSDHSEINIHLLCVSDTIDCEVISVLQRKSTLDQAFNRHLFGVEIMDLKEEVYKKLFSTGFNEQDIETLQILAIEAGASIAYPFKQPNKGDVYTAPCHGFIIPYLNPLTKTPTGFIRFRKVDLPIYDRLAKYSQQHGCMPEAYFSPWIDWSGVLKTVARTIYITEGELKAARLGKQGLPFIGLGGVWSFKSRKKGVEFLPELDAINWYKRDAVIIFDSDAAYNSHIIKAREQLAAELFARGANVKICPIPEIVQGKKCGVDDYIHAHGSSSMLTLLEGSIPYKGISKDIIDMNTKYVYVETAKMVYSFRHNMYIDASKFSTHFDVCTESEVLKSDGSIKKIKTAKVWLLSPLRASVESVTYAPGKDKYIDHKYNSWSGWGCTPKKGDVTPFLTLIEHLFNNDTAAIDFMLDWFSYPLQHPGTKLLTSVLVWGVLNGTGKSLLAWSIAQIYGDNYIELDDSSLHDARQTWATNKQFAIGNEVTSRGDRAASSKMKNLISRESIRIDEKFVPVFSIPDTINYYFTSNHPDAFFLDADDRRFYVWEVTACPKPPEFYREYMEWVSSGGVQYLFHFLLERTIKDFNPKGRAPNTKSKKDMMFLGLSDIARFAHELKYNHIEITQSTSYPKGLSFATSKELLSIYLQGRNMSSVTVGGLEKALIKEGIRALSGGKTYTVNSKRYVFWLLDEKYLSIENETVLKIFKGERV